MWSIRFDAVFRFFTKACPMCIDRCHNLWDVWSDEYQFERRGMLESKFRNFQNTLCDLRENVVSTKNWTRDSGSWFILPRVGLGGRQCIGKMLFTHLIFRRSNLADGVVQFILWMLNTQNSSIFMQHDSEFWYRWRCAMATAMVYAFACWFSFDFYILFSAVRVNKQNWRNLLCFCVGRWWHPPRAWLSRVRKL